MKISYFILLMLFSSISNATNSEESSSKKWKNIQINVAAITNLEDQFSKSVAIFAREANPYSNCKVINENSNTEIRDSEITHIHGDLNSNIYLDGHSELIIGGNVNPSVSIFVNGISRIFIGGDFKGSIIAKSSYSLHIMGSHSGLITTGNPSTKVIVHGDFEGKLQPNKGKGALASIQVHGFTDIKAIKKIYANKYTQLNGAFYNSNITPGIYQPQPPFPTFYTVINQTN